MPLTSQEQSILDELLAKSEEVAAPEAGKGLDVILKEIAQTVGRTGLFADIDAFFEKHEVPVKAVEADAAPAAAPVFPTV